MALVVVALMVFIGSVMYTPSSTNNTVSQDFTSLNEPPPLTDRQIVEAVYKIYEVDFVDEEMKAAEKVCVIGLGRITSEEDAIKKAEAVWTNQDGVPHWSAENASEYRSRLDKDDPYFVKYYEEYDAWWVHGNLPSGRWDPIDGCYYDIIGTTAYIILRGSDGKVLAIGAG